MKTIGLVIKPEITAQRKADLFEKWLISEGCRTVRKQLAPPDPSFEQRETAPDNLFCVFVMGGDGTFLSAVRWLGNQPVPVIGAKFGEVGFLAETTEDGLIPAARAILEGNFTTRPRMRLEISVLRDGKTLKKETALNDVVINKGALARLARMRTYIDNKFITEYRADGLIIATPTGSTAYSLAAGGPIIHPSVQGILITPICPFTLTNRPLIIPETAKIKIRLSEKTSDLMLTFDGQVGLKITERDTILVRKSSNPVNLIILPGQDYFDVLKAKLQWSGSRI